MRAISLFSGAGVCEYYLSRIGVNVIVANEIIKKRADTYKYYYANCQMINDDITKPDIKERICQIGVNSKVDLIIATPPCQGVSTAGLNKTIPSLFHDPRNFLVLSAIDIFEFVRPDYFIIENVPRFQKMLFPYNGKFVSLYELLTNKFSDEYNVTMDILNAADYGVPQTRYRVVYRIWRKNHAWKLPQKEYVITLREAIGNLPSLEAGESSNIKNHWARKVAKNHIECMKHTPTGKSAFENDIYYPKKPDGTRINGYGNTYKRMRWDCPAPTITMRNEIISSQENVHPGRLLPDGTWSDARVLTLRELLILSSLPPDLDIPKFLTETAFRQIVGEGIPPLMFEKIIKGIDELETPASIKGLSLFAGGGIAETYFKEVGINIAIANELLPVRAGFYQHTHPDTEMICGDITDDTVFNKVIKRAKEEGVKFLLATPPCQGMSTLGKREYKTDKRNSLVHYVLKAIDEIKPEYVLIENVPKFIELLFNEEGSIDLESNNYFNIVDLLKKRYSEQYIIEMKVLNAMNYGVPQSRPRAIIKMFKKNLNWPWPEEDNHIITLREAIGDLPSLESGERSSIKWHNALIHNERQVLALKHTPEGKSAMKNEVYYPKKADGSRVKGFHNTYNRMRWDEPAPARTTNNHLMSGHNNVHPGRLLPDGTWSDARVLTLRELIIVSSLPLDWNIPDNIKEADLRIIIGEAIPPLLSKKIVQTIFNH